MQKTSASRLAGRLLAAGAAVGAMVIAGASPALADPGGGHGHSASAPGQVKKQDGSGATQTASGSSASPGSSDHSQGTAGTSGVSSQPQPLSGADQNPGGANGQCPGGPYCSTRDGSPSGNGNGNGQATGKPCAGCVGKADNKNPKGQMPNGSDHNAGYECDRNHGIGRTNPAHTGCSSTTPSCTGSTCQPCTANCTPPPCTSNCGPPGCVGSQCKPCVPTAANHNCGQVTPPGCVPTPANHQCGHGPQPECVPTQVNHFCGTSVKGKKVIRKVVGERVVNTPPTLPFTGINAASLLEVSGLLAAAGLLLMTVGRRRRYAGRHRLA